MHPDLITLPGGINIKTYGFFLMVGFLSAVWLAMRRASRVNVDPDRVLDISFLALLAGVSGARLFYVVHYWDTQFADRSNKLLAIVDIRQGGLEFLGGLLGAIVVVVGYLVLRRQSIRLFLDIMAPSAMWGLALGRMGCFFNGCCFGAPCQTPDNHPRYFWAMKFPYGSNAHVSQWEQRKVTLPAELITTNPEDLLPWPVPEPLVNASIERLEGPKHRFLLAQEAFNQAKSEGRDADQVKKLEERMKAAQRALAESEREFLALRLAQQFPSRTAPERKMLPSELRDLAAAHPSLPVHPTQVYAAINGALLTVLLSAVFSRRKRHGVVIGLLFVLYPVARIFEEIIRADNPHDVGGLTVSQFVSLMMLAFGVVYLIVLYTRMPLRSPRADEAAAPRLEEAVAA